MHLFSSSSMTLMDEPFDSSIFYQMLSEDPSPNDDEILEPPLLFPRYWSKLARQSGPSDHRYLVSGDQSVLLIRNDGGPLTMDCENLASFWDRELHYERAENMIEHSRYLEFSSS